jgi:hypothetical protein
MWSLRIVMLPQVMMMIVMMTRPPRRVMQALPYKRSILSSTLHHASWLRPLRYKLCDDGCDHVMKYRPDLPRGNQ